MDRRELSIQTRVKASTILEVVVSMVIIILVFGIAMMIYTNVLRMSLSVKKIKAQALLQETLLKAETTKDRSTQSLIMDDLRIEQEIKPFNNDSLLSEIHLTAYDANQQKITELQKVISNK
jgi:type II secretory pathway component PulJ